MGLEKYSSKMNANVERILARLPLNGFECLLIPAIYIYFKWENWSSLGDTQYYTQSGYEILTGGNPYLGDVKWGSFSAITMYLFLGWYSSIIANIILVLVNLLGIYFFAKAQEVSTQTASIVTLLVVITSINRENLVNGQITGLILLSIAYAKKLLAECKYLYLASALSLFAIEMKPHITIPLILFMFHNISIPWKKFLTFTIGAHLSIFLFNGNLLEKDFLKQIITRSVSNPEIQWENTNNLLPLIDVFVDNPSITKSIGLLIVIVSCVIVTLRTKYSPIMLFLLFLFMPYIHLYDLLGITIISFARYIGFRKITTSALVSLLVIFSPLRNLSIENIVLTVIVVLVLITSKYMELSKEKIYKSATLLLFIPNFVTSARPEPGVLLNSWISTSALIALVILGYKQRETQNAETT